MNNLLNSPIDLFFAVRYDEKGHRIHGKCKLCPNLLVKGHNTSNYWHHLQKFHEGNYTNHKKRLNSDNNRNNNDNNDNNDNNNENNENNMENDEENAQITAENNSSGCKRVKISESKQQVLDFPSVSVSKLAKFQQNCAETFARLGFPHSLIENNEFQQLFTEYESLKCDPSMKFAPKKHHRGLILKAAARIFSETLQILQNTNSFVTLALDGWTGQTYGAKNTNIVALANGKSYLLWSDRNNDEKDSTEDYLFPLVHEKIKFLLEKNVAICAITTDNAKNMLNIGRELYKLPGSGPVILHLSCSAHTIQLMLQEIMDLEPISSLIYQALSIIDPFLTKNGKQMRLNLRKSQVTAGKSPLKLILFNQTRWLSRFEAINRLIHLKTHIKWVYLNNSNTASSKYNYIQQESFWNKVEKVICPLLNAFKLATNMVQQDSASLLQLDQAISGIRKEINDCKIVEYLEASQQAENAFKFRANEYLNDRIRSFVLANGTHYAFWAISLLTDKKLAQWQSTFGDSSKDYNETGSWIANWGADITLFYPKHFEINCEREKSVIISTINRQMAEFEGGLGSFSEKQQYLRDFTQEIPHNSIIFDAKCPEKREINWILFWSKMKRSAPELSNVAVCLLSLGISEASCERSFSVQQLTHSKTRNRLNEDIVEAEMIIRYNKLRNNDSMVESDDSEIE
jgi:hypothetical protein